MSKTKLPPRQKYVVFQNNGRDMNTLYYTDDGIGTSPMKVRAKRYTLLEAQRIAAALTQHDADRGVPWSQAWGVAGDEWPGATKPPQNK